MNESSGETVSTPGQPRRRVLLTEDEGLTLILLERVLKSAGYEVVGTARNGKQAIEQARSLKPDFIIMDINMPVVDGVQAVRQIVAERSIPVIMLTGYGESERMAQAVAAGATAFLVKPVTRATLLAALEDAFGTFDQRQDGLPIMVAPDRRDCPSPTGL